MAIILSILLSIFLLSGVLMIRSAMRQHLHNEVLYSLRNTRHKMIMTLSNVYEDHEKMPQEQTKVVMGLISSLDNFCCNFNEAKTFFKSLTNFTLTITTGKSKKGSKKIQKNSIAEIKVYEVTNPTDQFNELRLMYNKSIYDCFIKLVPFLKFKLGFLLLTLFAVLLAMIGIESLKNLLNSFKLVSADERDLNYS